MPKEIRKLSSTPVTLTPYSGGGSRACKKNFSRPVCPKCSMDWFESLINSDESVKRPAIVDPAPGNEDEEEVGDNFDQIHDLEESDYDFLNEAGEFGDEDAYEGVGTGLKPGETFLDHIHFGDPEDKVWDEGYSVSNGIVRYWRTTSSGRTYEYRGLEGETDIARLRAM